MSAASLQRPLFPGTPDGAGQPRRLHVEEQGFTVRTERGSRELLRLKARENVSSEIEQFPFGRQTTDELRRFVAILTVD